MYIYVHLSMAMKCSRNEVTLAIIQVSVIASSVTPRLLVGCVWKISENMAKM